MHILFTFCVFFFFYNLKIHRRKFNIFFFYSHNSELLFNVHSKIVHRQFHIPFLKSHYKATVFFSFLGFVTPSRILLSVIFFVLTGHLALSHSSFRKWKKIKLERLYIFISEWQNSKQIIRKWQLINFVKMKCSDIFSINENQKWNVVQQIRSKHHIKKMSINNVLGTLYDSHTYHHDITKYLADILYLCYIFRIFFLNQNDYTSLFLSLKFGGSR